MADYTAYFKGDWMTNNEISISPVDRGFMVGDVVFDVERTFDGKSFRMKEHIDRLYRSLKYTRIDPGLSAEEMLGISEEVIQRNEHLRADVGRLHHLAVRDPRRRPPGVELRAVHGMRQGGPHPLRMVRQRIHGGDARRHHADAELLAGGP